MRYFLLIVTVFALSLSYAQNKSLLKRSYSDSSHEEYYVVSKVIGSINYSSSKYYYWYKNQKVHKSQGTSGGYLLHGVYVKYASSHAILERGNFKEGLKVGLWRKWDLEGKIIEESNWNNGSKNGIFRTESDTLNYRNGLLHGEAFHNKDGKRSFGKYKRGVKRGKWVEETDTLFYKNGSPQKFEPFFKRLFKKKEREGKKSKKVDKSKDAKKNKNKEDSKKTSSKSEDKKKVNSKKSKEKKLKSNKGKKKQEKSKDKKDKE